MLKDMESMNNKAFHKNVYQSPPGLGSDIVHEISRQKNEPAWMLEFRLKALNIFEQKPMPTWGADLSGLNIQDMYYYIKPLEQHERTWDKVPESIKTTFEQLGIPQAERQFLAGVGAQFESEIIYKNLKAEWAAQGVIFCDISYALEHYPELVQRYLATVIAPHDNKFAALNSAVWSGGSFVYVPEGVHVTMPLQAYFRINNERMGQFERTLIIAERASSVHYVEGCSAPIYKTSSLHSAVVEIVAHQDSQVRYTTIQNWSNNVYNLVTKRAIAYKNAHVAWIDGNFGSRVTMKYPSIILKEPGAKGEVISIAVAGNGQYQDTGAKMIHCAPHTTSTILSKSMSKDGGHCAYRGLLKVLKGAKGVQASVNCESLLLDEYSQASAFPTNDVQESECTIGHEASMSTISQEQLVYLMSRGFTQAQAQAMIVNGFIDSFVQQLPMEYAVEINRLIALQMEGSIG